nr:MAG TPA: hypothetical protein [Caudoviricetes sp.]
MSQRTVSRIQQKYRKRCQHTVRRRHGVERRCSIHISSLRQDVKHALFLCKGGENMGKGMNTLKGKVTTHGAMYVESDVKSTSKKPTVKKGGDLRAKGDK